MFWYSTLHVSIKGNGNVAPAPLIVVCAKVCSNSDGIFAVKNIPAISQTPIFWLWWWI
jgi:hypothetical protein